MIQGMELRVLLVQPEAKTVQPLARYFRQRDHQVWQASDLPTAWQLIEQVRPNLVFMDLHFPGDGWIAFLRRLRGAYPECQLVMTNTYPDLQREMVAREQQVRVFLRQPFTDRWIDQAMARLSEQTQPVRRSRAVSPVNEEIKTKPGTAAEPQAVRMPMRVKITLPYLLLALLFALAAAYLVSKVVLESVQDRYQNQLIETARQSADWMVSEENRLLRTLRLVNNTEGFADAVQREDAEALRSIILPIAVNAGEEAIEVLGLNGTSLFSLHQTPGGGPLDYTFTRGEQNSRDWDFVRKVIAGQVDPAGDKFSGWGQTGWGNTFYVSGPIFNKRGELTGVLLVGKSLTSLARQMSQATLGDVTLYDRSGSPLTSTLSTAQETFPLDKAQVERTFSLQDQQALSRDLTVASIDYAEILGPWEVRGGEDQGILGVSLAKAFLVRTSAVTRVEIYALVAASILLVLIIGVILANRITSPLLRLVNASGEIAQGNLEIKVDASGNDELAVLAQSFNYMVAGLQEGSIYRDLLGRTVSPEVREQLRQTFTTGNLRLEGQQAVAAVLMCDIRGFTPISERSDPAKVFQWLNEYFAQIVPIITKHGGVVNKLDGDAVLAFFGILPRMLSPRQSAVSACQAAVEMIQAIDRLNDLREQRGEPPLITGIGVNTGLVIAGGLGTSDRLHYTIIGDTVNAAQRIESLTRDLMDCSGILVSQATRDALPGSTAFRFQLMGEHSLKGRAAPVTVYRLLPSQGEISQLPGLASMQVDPEPESPQPEKEGNQ